MSTPDYDYIILGAGSAGCVLANRLSADPAVSVLLVEAGGRDWHPYIHMPAGLAKLVDKESINWGYETEPESSLENRRLYWPRGKVLGGCSSINAMCYARGHRKDYDHWAELGNEGWSFQDVLPFFRLAEDQERGSDEFHGQGGPLGVRDLRHHNPLSEVFLEAANQAGFSRNDDFNGETQRGFGYYQVTQRGGQRCSTASGYLDPVKNRPNLTIMTNTMSERLLVEGGRATGVVVRRRGQAYTLSAKREVLVSCGAINSPQLLMLSGIGPAEHLAEMGIDCVKDLPGVGANLQDHLDICTLYHCTQPITYDTTNDLAIGLQYLLFHKGIGTSNIAESGGFVVSSLATDDRPDMQFHFVPAMLDDHGRNRLDGHGFTIHACALRPGSRGQIRLKSDQPDQYPSIEPNYLSDPMDMKLMIEGVRISRKIIASSAFDAYRGDEIFPGSDLQSEAEIEDFIRRKAETIYHPIGTCKMGVDDSAVVDPQLRVHGIDGLRVIDASVMPTLVSGNTNAPTVMIAEKIADSMIRANGGQTAVTATMHDAA
ncbi:MAG: choline dehydrogenase [Lysobacteraceae bacterium]|nr:MAG: choline dehydrogenase [Xanthomonadaceae bacterium]